MESECVDTSAKRQGDAVRSGSADRVARHAHQRDGLGRRVRRAVTRGVVRAAMVAARQMPMPVIRVGGLAMRRWMSRFGPMLPVAADIARRNMQRAGVWTTAIERRWYDQVARHLAAAAYVFHLTGKAARHGEPPLAAPARARVQVDDSIEHLRAASAAGRGVILACPHTCQFFWALARLHQETPLTVFLRYSRHAYGRAAKEAWCRGAGIGMIAEPSMAADPAARAEKLADALRAGRTIVITPDVAQPTGRGVLVQLWGRRVSMASGVSALSLLTGAPVVMAYSVPAGERIRTVFHEPITACNAPRKPGWRKEAMRQIQQQWTDLFAGYIARHPEMWWMWLDNRWTRALSGDAKYSGPDNTPAGA